MSLRNDGFRFMVSPDRRQSRWIHPAEISQVAADWVDCTDMDDAQFDEFMGVIESGKPNKGTDDVPGRIV